MKKTPFLIILATFCSLNTRAQQTGPPPTADTGLEITRSALLKHIIKIDASMNFKDIPVTKEFVTIKGTDDKSAVLEIYGNENDVESAKWTFTFGTDTAVNKAGLVNTAGFIFVLADKKGLDWYFAQFTQINNNRFTKFTTSKLFDYMRKLELIYDPAEKKIRINAAAP